MKKISLSTVLGLLLIVGTACGEEGTEETEGTADVETEEANADESDSNGEAAEGDTYEIKLAENQPDDYPTTIGDKAFAEMVDERSDGRIQVEVFSGGQLGDERSVLEQVQIGSIEMARTNASPLTEFSEDIGVLSMPYLFENDEAMWDVLLSEVGDDLLDSLNDASMQGLAFYDSGSRSLYNAERPINGPDDVDGLQIRVQESDMMVDLIEALGGSPTTMAFEEVYSGLETGVVDGAENNFPSYYSTNHYEVAEYYTLNAHSTVPEVLVMAEDVWNQMSEEDQQIVREAAQDSIEVQREAWDELVEESRETIEENGNQITEVDDYTDWREAVEPLYEKYGTEYQDWIDRIEEAQ
ncbi:TRAP transporter substrate-binding protein [Alteribacillus sp. YIM 98480]|uniref:TRAP transporter substrate-binding protein n=1 Tax=Alteribacillus sp. YIM 98480 TaxID=2606599 RepID=UPI00131BDC17|nr:TRAP transporter substrate-binding protein [Alteribacillus sp. YIM 98480]